MKLKLEEHKYMGGRNNRPNFSEFFSTNYQKYFYAESREPNTELS